MSPTMSEMLGRYVHDSGTGGGAIELRPDSTFFYEVWGCIPEYPIMGYSGTYMLIGDSLKLTFVKVVYRDSDEGLKLREAPPRAIKAMPRYFTEQYTPSFFFRYQGNVYLVSHENLNRITDLTDFQSKIGPLMGYFLKKQDKRSSVNETK